MSSATERVDPRCCQSCRTTEAACDSKRLFRSARCCDNCDHDNAVVSFEQHKGYILTVWSVVLLDEVDEWFVDLAKRDPESADLVAGAIDLLEADGPTLGRPAVDRVKGSRLHNLKELRPGSSGETEIRVLFIFDPTRQAVLLVAGDKTGAWKDWYRDNIPVAEERYESWLGGHYDVEVRDGP